MKISVLLMILLSGCTTINIVEPQPRVIIIDGARVAVPPPNIVRDQMKSRVMGYMQACLNNSVYVERRLGRLPRRLEIEGHCAGSAVAEFSWLSGASDGELREIRTNFELMLDRVDWNK